MATLTSACQRIVVGFRLGRRSQCSEPRRHRTLTLAVKAASTDRQSATRTHPRTGSATAHGARLAGRCRRLGSGAWLSCPCGSSRTGLLSSAHVSQSAAISSPHSPPTESCANLAARRAVFLVNPLQPRSRRRYGSGESRCYPNLCSSPRAAMPLLAAGGSGPLLRPIPVLEIERRPALAAPGLAAVRAGRPSR